MARLPQPGGDAGNWGDILNDYLAQSHKANGLLKDSSVTSSTIASNAVTAMALAPNSVTSAALASDSVNATTIADGSITEPLLASAVQTKLNAPTFISDGSITKAQLAAAVQSSIDKADTSVQPADIAAKSNDNAVVHIAGTETITGAKNFTGGATINSTNIVVATDTRLTDARTPSDNSVSTIKLQDNSVSAPKIADTAITRGKLSTDVQSGIASSTSGTNGIAYAIVDQLNNYGLIISNDGSLGFSKLDNDTALRTAAQLSPLLPSVVPVQYKSSYNSSAVSIVSGPDIVAVGDSLTAGAGGNGTTYGSVLATAVGKTVRVSAVGGESSVAINARQGGQPYLLLPQGNQLPASGGVTVTLSLPGGLTAWPLLQGTGTGGVMRGTLAGVSGVLTLTQPSNPGASHNPTDYYTFTRDTSGSTVSITRPSPFYIDFNVARRSDIYSYWYGRNNLSATAQVLGDIASSIAYQTALDKRYVVLTVLNHSSEATGSTNYISINTLNTQLLQTYGRRCIDVRKYLIEYGLADAGITATAQDNTDIANDVIPVSLRADGIHLNSAGYTVVGNLVANRLNELGWIS